MSRTDIPRRLIRDNDGHWYLIPVSQLDAFEAWIESNGEDEPPFLFQRIDGPHTLNIYQWEELT